MITGKTSVRNKAEEVSRDLSKWAQSRGLISPGIRMRVTVQFENTRLTPEDWQRIGYFRYATSYNGVDRVILNALYDQDNSPVQVKKLADLLPSGFEPMDMAWLNDFVLKSHTRYIYRLRALRSLRRHDIASWESNAVFLVRYTANAPEIAGEDTYDPYWFYIGDHRRDSSN